MTSMRKKDPDLLSAHTGRGQLEWDGLSQLKCLRPLLLSVALLVTSGCGVQEPQGDGKAGSPVSATVRPTAAAIPAATDPLHGTPPAAPATAPATRGNASAVRQKLVAMLDRADMQDCLEAAATKAASGDEAGMQAQLAEAATYATTKSDKQQLLTAQLDAADALAAWKDAEKQRLAKLERQRQEQALLAAARRETSYASGRSSSGASGTSSTEDPFANLPVGTFVVKVYARTGGFVFYERQLAFSVTVKARFSEEAKKLAEASVGGSFADEVKKSLGNEWYWDNVEVEQR